MACSPLAAGSLTTVKARLLPANAIEPNDEALRASSQVSICCAETTGTPRASAELTAVSDSTIVAASVWALIV